MATISKQRLLRKIQGDFRKGDVPRIMESTGLSVHIVRHVIAGRAFSNDAFSAVAGHYGYEPATQAELFKAKVTA